MQDFISKESETSVFIEAKAVALIYCLIKKNDIFHLSEMRKQELHSPPPLCFAMQNIGEGLRKKIICLKNLTPLPCGHSPYLI